jgi:hypothetical protein
MALTKRKPADTRATCLNCIDGRVQQPVLGWIREKHRIDLVDVITEPGMDGVLSSQDNIDNIIKNVEISIKANGSRRVFIVGHHDCKGNPADEKTHLEQIAKSVERLKAYWPGLEITGLWVNSRWHVEACCK